MDWNSSSLVKPRKLKGQGVQAALDLSLTPIGVLKKDGIDFFTAVRIFEFLVEYRMLIFHRLPRLLLIGIVQGLTTDFTPIASTSLMNSLPEAWETIRNGPLL